jgi:hypothetical protein
VSSFKTIPYEAKLVKEFRRVNPYSVKDVEDSPRSQHVVNFPKDASLDDVRDMVKGPVHL